MSAPRTKESFDPRKASLGELLVWMGVVTEEQLRKALEECDPEQKNLGQILVAMGFATEDKITKAVSVRLGIPYFTSFEDVLEPEAARLIPEAMARKHLAVPLFREDDSVTVGMVNPIDIHAIDEIGRQTGLKVRTVMTPLPNLMRSIEDAYGARSSAPKAVAKPEALQQVKESFVRFQAEERSVVQLVDDLLQQAMLMRASDIHLEPAEKVIRSRFRVDGVLQDGKTFERELAAALVARIKILSQLDITETRLPQDGHLRFEYGGRNVDVRVSTLPTVHGEKAVLRILDPFRALRKLGELGLSQGNLKAFEEAIHLPNGLILVTGPTGSGKTTTLYAGLQELNQKSRNIVTLEDPVEYRIDRINQMETLPKIGLTFAAGLRSILRQDPNVILVGEIRDRETAEIAIQASITGHLVFSTLHTNHAVAAVDRLVQMGVEPFLVAASIRGVLAQRLVRMLCEKCKRPHKATQAEAELLGQLVEGGTFYDPVGCGSCLQTGYSGRHPIHEWLGTSRPVRELILARQSADRISEQARSEGMRDLMEDALEKAARGITSIAEALRVTRLSADL